MTAHANQPSPNRRKFLQSATVLAGSVATHSSLSAAGYHHSVDDTLRVGLIGCGGRGNGAAINAAKADSNVKITALCDVFADRIQASRSALMQSEIKDKVSVDDDHCFDGLDGYKNLIDSGVDVVLLCTTPYFRPDHVEAAVAAKKHIFCEKPIATDVAGALRVRAACEKAGMDINIVSGLCWRYDHGVRAVIDKIKNGEIGEIRAIQENYLTGTLWHRGNNPNWSPLEYQLRNWLYFTWLSGDFIAEQHIHSLDKSLWLMNDQPPVSCYGTGGRQVRVEEKWGDVYDHFACCYEWENGVKTFSYCRQMDSCMNDTDDYVIGTKGRAQVLRFTVEPNDRPRWQYQAAKGTPDMYDSEHLELFRAIRSGGHINNGDYMVKSTLMAILGREACYTGKKITWNELLESKLKLGPEKIDWEHPPVPEVQMPGRSRAI